MALKSLNGPMKHVDQDMELKRACDKNGKMEKCEKCRGIETPSCALVLEHMSLQVKLHHILALL